MNLSTPRPLAIQSANLPSKGQLNCSELSSHFFRLGGWPSFLSEISHPVAKLFNFALSVIGTAAARAGLSIPVARRHYANARLANGSIGVVATQTGAGTDPIGG